MEEEECYKCGVTIEYLVSIYTEEPVKRLFMCLNHGENIVCFHCFHAEKYKTLFKCQCSTIEHWISRFPCGQSAPSEVQLTKSQPERQFNQHVERDGEEDDGVHQR